MLPVTAALAAAIEVHPCGMLPVATPLNAIVYGSRYVTIIQMARAGVWLNLAGAVVITAFVCFFLPRLWGIRLDAAADLIH